MPGIEVLLEAMGAASIFTKLDLKKGYYQVAVNPDQDKTIFVTQWGKSKFLIMPFGFRNALSTFQRLMDSVLRDILVFSRSDTVSLVSLGQNTAIRLPVPMFWWW